MLGSAGDDVGRCEAAARPGHGRRGVPGLGATEQRHPAGRDRRRWRGFPAGECICGGRGRRVGVVDAQFQDRSRCAVRGDCSWPTLARYHDPRDAGDAEPPVPPPRRRRRDLDGFPHAPHRGRAGSGWRARGTGHGAGPLGVGDGGRRRGGDLRLDLPPWAGLRDLRRRDAAAVAPPWIRSRTRGARARGRARLAARAPRHCNRLARPSASTHRSASSPSGATRSGSRRERAGGVIRR